MNEDFNYLKELKREGEEIIFSEKKRRMMLLSEIWDQSRSQTMEKLSEQYGIDSRSKFEAFKEKYNLTDY